MKVFLSWSGERSRLVATLLDEWLRCVLQAIRPWISTKDIDRGALWFNGIQEQLQDTTTGIICLTQENKDKPWILFEAGALAKGLSNSRVCTLLIDLKPNDIQDPLAQLNHTSPTKDGILALVKTLNNRLGSSCLDSRVLDTVFETYWPHFQDRFEQIIQATPLDRELPVRQEHDILNELLTLTRSLSSRIITLENRARTVDEIALHDRAHSGCPETDDSDEKIATFVHLGYADEKIAKILTVSQDRVKRVRTLVNAGTFSELLAS